MSAKSVTLTSADVMQAIVGRTVASVVGREDQGMSYEIVVTFTDGSSLVLGPEYDEGIVATMTAHSRQCSTCVHYQEYMTVEQVAEVEMMTPSLPKEAPYGGRGWCHALLPGDTPWTSPRSTRSTFTCVLHRTETPT